MVRRIKMVGCNPGFRKRFNEIRLIRCTSIFDGVALLWPSFSSFTSTTCPSARVPDGVPAVRQLASWAAVKLLIDLAFVTECIFMYSGRNMIDESERNAEKSADNSAENGADNSVLSSDYIAWAIVSHILGKQVDVAGPSAAYDNQAPLSEAQMKRVHDYFHHHLQGGFQIAELAATLGMSRTSFFKRFGRTAKVTPNQYLQILRVEKAKILLRNENLSLIEIAFACGYADQSHLARFFKRYVRMSPGRYRSKLREEEEVL